jgi:predicted CxxxxCH...CXXCH cytochrome family protein
VNVSLLTSYKTKKSASNPVYNADGSCANVSCHGGNTTPVWGSANGLTCSACHEQGSAYQVPEYNSYYSGTFLGINLHSYHLAQTNPGTVALITCTNCHDSAKLTKQQHFGGLAARSFVFPGNTIGGVNTRMGRYDTSARTCSTVSCHSLVPQNNIGWFNF